MGTTAARATAIFPVMNIHVDSLPECKVSLRIEIPAEDVREERRQVTDEFLVHGKLAGFRPGKAPRKLVERRFQRQIQSELEKRLLNESYKSAIEKEKVEVLMIDKVVPPEFHQDDSMTYTVVLVTVPEFELPDYKGIQVQAPRVVVEDRDIDEEVEGMRRELATYEEVTDRAAETGDFAEVTYTGRIDGQPLAEAEPEAPATMAAGEGQWMAIDETTFLPGFTDALVGRKPGDQLVVTVTVPEDFAVEFLRGREVEYEVTLVNLRRQVLPEFTDEYVKEQFGEQAGFESFDDLREAIRKNLIAQRERQRSSIIERQLLAWLDNQLQFDLPSHLLYSETQRRVNEIANRALQSGYDEQKINEQGDQIINSAAQMARINVKAGFVLERIAEAESIKAEHGEITNYLMSVAIRERRNPQQVLKEAQKEGSIPRIADDIRMQKTMAFLVEQAAVTEVDPPTREELEAQARARAAAQAEAEAAGAADASDPAGIEESPASTEAGDEPRA